VYKVNNPHGRYGDTASSAVSSTDTTGLGSTSPVVLVREFGSASVVVPIFTVFLIAEAVARTAPSLLTNGGIGNFAAMATHQYFLACFFCFTSQPFTILPVGKQLFTVSKDGCLGRAQYLLFCLAILSNLATIGDATPKVAREGDLIIWSMVNLANFAFGL
jgi:hypothetical protein